LVDPDGDPITSLVVIPADGEKMPTKTKRGKGKALRLAIDIIGEMAVETIRPFNDNLQVKAAKVDAVRDEFNRRWVGEPTAQRQAWRRVINNRDHIAQRDGKCWLIKSSAG
jgi:hypothetical protein